jgi:twitching motility protein PilU
LRHINTTIPKLEDLHLPPGLKDITMMPRGLVIIVGSTGSGKSTTLAAMIGHRNQSAHDHIITVEDPIEFVHEHGQCIITQREVGMDTLDWECGAEEHLRQAPDVI